MSVSWCAYFINSTLSQVCTDRKNIARTGFSIICGLRYPPEALEHVSHGYGGTTVNVEQVSRHPYYNGTMNGVYAGVLSGLGREEEERLIMRMLDMRAPEKNGRELLLSEIQSIIVFQQKTHTPKTASEK